MRLVDVDTLRVQLFSEAAVPEYAILSHTWGSEEITFQDMREIEKLKRITRTIDSNIQDDASTLAFEPSLMFPVFELLFNGPHRSAVEESFRNSEKWYTARSGYTKIINAAAKAKSLGMRYVWVDTCCIDKTSSAELQEAINSMYRWYKNAAVCLVYLSDAAPSSAHDLSESVAGHFRRVLAASRWVTRVWTLQELIAPRWIRFYAHDWTYLCSKITVLSELADVTGVPVAVLELGDPNQACVAQRMSWASKRSSSRVEDIAYSLMGLFDIHMPMLYGEGEKAFVRLQEEILKTSDDLSIFAWTPQEVNASVYRGLLARSPTEFESCSTMMREPSARQTFPIASTNIGLRLQLDMKGIPGNDSLCVASLYTVNFGQGVKPNVDLVLRRIDSGDQYARVFDNDISFWTTGTQVQGKTIFIRQNLVIPHDHFSQEMHSFYIREEHLHATRAVRVWPPSCWDFARKELSIAPEQDTSLGVVFFEPFREKVFQGNFAFDVNDIPSFQVIVGFQRDNRHYWLKIVTHAWPDMDREKSFWLAEIDQLVSIRDRHPHHHLGRSASFKLRFGDWELLVAGTVRASLSCDRIALDVQMHDELRRIYDPYAGSRS